MKDRTGYLGGSDISAVMGVSPYKTAYQLWKEKRGEDTGFNGNIHTIVGVELEALTEKLYTMATGRIVTEQQEEYAEGFMRAHIDGMSEGRVVEFKTAYPNRMKWGDMTEPFVFDNDGLVSGPDEFTGDFPLYYQLQCQWYMMLTGSEKADLAVLFTDKVFRIYTLNRSDTTISRMRSAAKQFWRCVESGEKPEAFTIADLAELYPESISSQIVADNDTIKLISERKTLKAIEKDRNRRIEEIEGLVKAQMKEADTITDSNGSKLCTWKTQNSRTVDWDAVPEDVKKDCFVQELSVKHLKAKHKSCYNEAVNKNRVFRG